MIKSRALKITQVFGAIIWLHIPLSSARASLITLDALNSFAYEVEPGAIISQPGIGNPGTSVPGEGPLLGTGLVFAIGTPDVANLSITDDVLGRDLVGGTLLIRPRTVITSDIQVTALVLSSGNLYHIDMISWLLDRGCVGVCANPESNTSFYIDLAPVPLPAALPLLAAGLSAMGLTGWRRKRKSFSVIHPTA